MRNWQEPHLLVSLTHFDGRNAAKLYGLRPYFSELAWMKERLGVMVNYVVAIARQVGKPLNARQVKRLETIVQNFSLGEGETVVRLEKSINHDLKALELYLVRRLPSGLERLGPYVNFGLGSEDINSIAFARLLTKSREKVLAPLIRDLAQAVSRLAQKEKDTWMVGRTHAVPAGLTTFGKELANSLLRLCDEVQTLRTIVLRVKASGEVGTFHALAAVSPDVNWLAFSDRFITSQGLAAAHGSTQIVPYDSIVRYLQSLGRVNAILADLSKNMWLYVLLGYVRVTKKEEEVGSAGMPHKVNPIYFEGAEGGFEMAHGIIETLTRKLMINRLQRDFSDSTVRRNTVLAVSLSVLSYQSMIEAFKRLDVNHAVMKRDLGTYAQVWIEPLKLLLLKHGVSDAYVILKEKTRGRDWSGPKLLDLVDTLNIPNKVKERAKELISGNPVNPYPARIVKEALQRVRREL